MKYDAPVIVMNMFYTGLGIARDLGEKGIPVIGLSSRTMLYGNLSRYADVRIAPDSRDAQDKLLDYLISLGRKQSGRPVIFPTRDHDVVFLMRHRRILEEYFMIPLAPNETLDKILNKARLIDFAAKCEVPVPKTYVVESLQEVQAIGSELVFPCVVKPAYSFVWHMKGAWEAVGGRKAFKVESMDQLAQEYKSISQVNTTVIVQEFIEGRDDDIYVLGSYFNRQSEPIACFTARKLIQAPAEFGTGCLVESCRRPEIEELGFALLTNLGYHGISEVEFKKDSADGQFKLIEINPRHWDWHRLGSACGVSLSLVAYEDLTGGRAIRPNRATDTGIKWVAEDAFFLHGMDCLLNDRGRINYLISAVKGNKTFAILDYKDPLPFLFLILTFIPNFTVSVIKYLFRRKLRIRLWGKWACRLRNTQKA